MGRGQRDPALERRWRERLAEWTSSGLSVREFCLRQGLLETAFYYWRRELRARDVAAASRSSASQSRVSQSRVSRSRVSQRPLTKKSPPTFVPVTVIPDATLAVEVRCPSGHVVWLSSCAAADLGSLFAALAPQAPLAPEAQPC